MSIEKFQPSYDIYPERIERLKTVVPESFADGKINWDILRESLGSFVESEDVETEHYAFTWPGKREARRMAGKPPQGTLVPASGEGLNEGTTENIFIEGDNLEVLKLLQKSYAGKIKMIYIDPPYNTGKDFVYNDNFTQPLDEYLKITGQIDETGNPLVSNRKTDGRFHSKWMSMMYPRLYLARNLLCEEGVIFISIDDTEASNLRKLCDEIFGEENFMTQIVWKNRYNAAKEIHLAQVHEYIFFYAKNIEMIDPIYLPTTEEYIERYFKNKDKNYSVRGPYRLQPLEAGRSMDNRENLKFGIPGPKGGLIYPKRQWKWGQERVNEALKKGEIEFTETSDGWSISTKQYLKDEDGIEYGVKGFSIIENIYNQSGTKEQEELFKSVTLFPFPKPSDLIKHLQNIAKTSSTDIVLDFFAGSATTAQSIFNLNLQDHNHRRFILVQIPEPCLSESEAVKAGYKTVAEIGKERIRRVIKKIKKERPVDEIAGQDLGFKVFRLQKSHFNEWHDYKGSDVKELMDLFVKQEDALVAGWKPENLILEVMLQEGFPLHSKVEFMETIKANKVAQVKSEFCQHIIFICLDEKIDKKTIGQLPLTDKDIFICPDKALTDEQKVTLSDKGVIKTI